MGWPTPQEYNEAIQNPSQNLADEELRGGRVALDSIGLPRVASGNFASVYQVRCNGRSVAVRCFLHDVSDQALRYEKITGSVMTDNLPYTVTFQYLKQGILVKGSWYPVLKMEWVEGQPLDQYVKQHAHDQARMAVLSEQFKLMVIELQGIDVAHGDLQHGNILVMANGADLRLVDYDGMFVPALSGSPSHELGHRNYQHPARSMHDFGPDLDNFAAWSIYTSLFCLSRDPRLVETPGVCDESLLFRGDDYRYPLRSHVFSVLESHANAEIRAAARQFRAVLGLPLGSLPRLDEVVVVPADLPPLAVMPLFSVHANLPSWMVAPEALTLALDPGVASAPETPDTEGQAEQEVVVGSAELAACPTVDDYLAALKEPRESLCRFPHLSDSVFPLSGGVINHVATDSSLVFPVFVGTEALALKVFLKPDAERSKRFRNLERLKHATPSLVEFLIEVEYFESGIKVKGKWYPLVVMPWLGGVTLRQLMRSTKSRTQLVEWAKQLRKLMETLEENELVHGDIEPGNLMAVGSKLKLLDYDTIRSKGAALQYPLPTPEYCHPRRVPTDNGGDDNFSAWVLDTALVCLSLSAAFRDVQKPGGDLFSVTDLQDPGRSPLFKQMLASKDALVRNRALLLQTFVSGGADSVPALASDAGLDRGYAASHSLAFHPVSPDRVSPDIRALNTRLAAKPVVVNDLGDAERSLPATVRRRQLPAPSKGSDVPFLAMVIAAALVSLMLVALIARLLVH